MPRETIRVNTLQRHWRCRTLGCAFYKLICLTSRWAALSTAKPALLEAKLCSHWATFPSCLQASDVFLPVQCTRPPTHMCDAITGHTSETSCHSPGCPAVRAAWPWCLGLSLTWTGSFWGWLETTRLTSPRAWLSSVYQVLFTVRNTSQLGTMAAGSVWHRCGDCHRLGLQKGFAGPTTSKIRVPRHFTEVTLPPTSLLHKKSSVVQSLW